MIFSLQFVLIFAGYGAVSSLSGNYMERYAGADDIQLGLYFMIPHFLHIARPFIGSQADRNGSHKRIYTWCAIIAGLSYLPYIILPFLLRNSYMADLLSKKACFWTLVCFHVTGSIALNGCRTLADALAKNHARRVNVEYVSLRKFAPVGLGLCAYLVGFINEEWILPDYVPSMISFSVCMLLLAILIHYWPDEYFHMISSDEEDIELPSTTEALRMFAGKLFKPLKRRSSYVKQLESMTFEKKYGLKDPDTNSDKSASLYKVTIIKTTNKQIDATSKMKHTKPLSFRQQISILLLVLRRDFRISLAFLVLLFCGWICRSAQNFVFVQLEDICKTKKICHPGKLSGDVLAGISLLEFLTYVGLNFCKGIKLNRLALLELAILIVAVHYYFYGFLIENLSARWFLVESLHGFEFAIFITTSLTWGYSFANEVEYIIPELKERNVISDKDDIGLVRVSLVATMMSCMTLLFEGFGSTIGSLIYGVVIEKYSYGLAWNINATIALLEFMIIFICLVSNKFFKFEPKMKKLKEEYQFRKKTKQQTVS